VELAAAGVERERPAGERDLHRALSSMPPPRSSPATCSCGTGRAALPSRRRERVRPGVSAS
jgi:hypothetical protein